MMDILQQQFNSDFALRIIMLAFFGTSLILWGATVRKTDYAWSVYVTIGVSSWLASLGLLFYSWNLQ